MGSGSGLGSHSTSQIVMTNSIPSNASVPCTPTTATAFENASTITPRANIIIDKKQVILAAAKQERTGFDALSQHLFEGLPEPKRNRTRSTASFLHMKDLASQSMFHHDCVYTDLREVRRRQAARAAVPAIRVGSSVVKQNSWGLIEKYGRLPRNDLEMDKWLAADRALEKRKRTALGGFKKEGYGKDDIRGLKRTASSVVEVRDNPVVKRSKSVPFTVAESSTNAAGRSTHFDVIHEVKEGSAVVDPKRCLPAAAVDPMREIPAPTSSQRGQTMRSRPNSQSIRHTFAATKPSSQDIPEAKANNAEPKPLKPVNGWNNARRKSGLEEKRRRLSEEKEKEKKTREEGDQGTVSRRPVWAAKVPGDDSDTEEEEEDAGLSSMGTATARSYTARPRLLETAFRKTMAQRTVDKVNVEVDELGSSLPAMLPPAKTANQDEIDELGSSLNNPTLPPQVTEISFANVRTSTPINRQYSSPAKKSFSQMSEPNHDESGTDEEEHVQTNPEVYGMILDLIDPLPPNAPTLSPIVRIGHQHRFAQAVQPSQSTQSGTPPSSQRMSTQRISKMARDNATDMVALLNGDIEDQMAY